MNAPRFGGDLNQDIFDPSVEEEWEDEQTEKNDGHLKAKADYAKVLKEQTRQKTLADSQNIVGTVFAYPDIENMKETFMYETIAMVYHPPNPDGSRPQINPMANWIIIEGDGGELDDGSVWVAWYDNELFKQQCLSFLYWDKAKLIVPPRKLVPMPGAYVDPPDISEIKTSVAPNPIMVWHGSADDFKQSGTYSKYKSLIQYYSTDAGGRAIVLPKKDNRLGIMFMRSPDVFSVDFKTAEDFDAGVKDFESAGAVSNDKIAEANIAYHKKLIAKAVQKNNQVASQNEEAWQTARQTAEVAIYNQNHRANPKTSWEAFGEGVMEGVEVGAKIAEVVI